LEGVGVERNYEEALKWFLTAAQACNNSARLNIGIIYATGRGIPRSDVHAYAWWLIAAEDGHQKALEYLGRIEAGMSLDQIKAGKDESIRLHQTCN
jgi:TPR repeat protein